jgi:hypothetical protein
MKIGLLLGLAAALTACAPKPPPLDPDVAAKIKAMREGPYTRGKSTEDELFAARGQPLSRTVADDGTRTDIYLPVTIHLDGSSGTMKIVNAPNPADMPDIRTHYVYSSDGILRHILFDTITKGPDGEDQHHIDEAQDKVTVTARRKAGS